MYSRKKVGSRMEPRGTPALTGYSFEDFLSRTYWSRLLWPNIWPDKARYLNWSSIRLKFVKKTSMSNPVKSLGYIKCYSLSSPRPVKSHSNSIKYNCQKSAVDRVDLQPYWKSEKGPHSPGDQQVYYLQVFQILY